MINFILDHRRRLVGGLCLAALAVMLALATLTVRSHIVPPERFHPLAESYRRLTFLLNLNPVIWDEVRKDADAIADQLGALSSSEAQAYRRAVIVRIDSISTQATDPEVAPGPAERKEAARQVFELSTRAVARVLTLRLQEAEDDLDNYSRASRALNEARQIWASFEHEVKATDSPAFLRIGECWLELAGALGTRGVLKVGYISADEATFRSEAEEIIAYVNENYGEGFRAPEKRPLSPLPQHSPTYDPTASVPVKLAPGSEINKQLPRPRQILNMTARGVDESETVLIALGDMAFDSPLIFGDPARSLAFSCNTCHNKSITNPNFFIPGLSGVPGGVDVSSSFFAAQANNGHFDPLDIPDLRGIRFTAPYGRNGRFSSLREFVRNGIMHEFNGPEPDPLLLDALIAYMNEFDFLPNPNLNPDGTLSGQASAAAKRGEVIFHTLFEGLGRRSCASCHVPSDSFLDRKRHDIGTVARSEPYSRDGALDTPTLLGIKYTASYFHDGSQATLREVNEWFNTRFQLGLTPEQVDDLTAYVEAVGEGVEAYEDTVHTLEAEMEEFSFFLSAYDYLKRVNKTKLIDITFRTIALEIRAHKWDVQNPDYLPVLDQLAELMDQAYAANQAGDRARVDALVADYLRLYQENVEYLK